MKLAANQQRRWPLVPRRRMTIAKANQHKHNTSSMPSLIKELLLPVSGFVANLCLILCFHVHADAYRENDNDTTTTTTSDPLVSFQSSEPTTETTTSSSSTAASLWWQFWKRIAQGPDALQPLDKILFGVVILLAFELLDFLTKSSGST
jgi:hypothetical protein